MQVDDINDEMDSNEDIEAQMQKEEEEEYGILGGSNRRIKSAKNMIKTQTSFYFKFFFVVLVIESYYLYNYIIFRLFSSDTRVKGGEMNITSSAEPFYWLALNTQRELYYNPDSLIMG